jgi:hypothetical protein
MTALLNLLIPLSAILIATGFLIIYQIKLNRIKRKIAGLTN